MMLKIKTVVLILLLAAVLFIGQPAVTRANNIESNETPPAIVLVQDKDNPMLLKHNFEADNGLLIPWDISNVDNGFYVQAPANNDK